MSKLIDNHRDDDDATDHDQRIGIRNLELCTATADHGDDQRADHGPQNRTSATGEASPTEHDCRNDLKIFASTIIRIAILDIGKVEQASHRDKKTCQRVSREASQWNIDAAKPSGRLTGTHRKNIAPENRVTQQPSHQQSQDDRDDNARGNRP